LNLNPSVPGNFPTMFAGTIRSIIAVALAILVFRCQATREKLPSSASYSIPLKGSAWQITVEDVDDDQVDELIYSTYDGYIRCLNITDQHEKWETYIGSFTFDLKCLRSARNQIIITAATADSGIVALNAEGHRLWQFNTGFPMYNIAFGNFENDLQAIACGGIDRHLYLLDFAGKTIAQAGPVSRLIQRLAVADLDGDQVDEIAVVDYRTLLRLYEFKDNQLIETAANPMSLPEKYVNWENPGGLLNVYSLASADLDGDGQSELVAGDAYQNKQAIGVMDGKAHFEWISDGIPFFTYIDGAQTEFYSQAMVDFCNFDDRPGKEIISVAGGYFRIHDREGRLLFEQNASIGFTDLFVREDLLYLGSSPNGDQNAYVIDLSKPLERQIDELQRQPPITDITTNIAEIRQAVLAYQPDNDLKLPTYDIYLSFKNITPDEEGYEQYLKLTSWFRKQFPYPNLRICMSMKLMESAPPLDENGQPWSENRWKVDAIRGTMTVDEIISSAEWIERHKIPTLFYIGHSCMPFISLETAERVLRATPEYGIGFITSEDEQIERIPRYIKHYFGPLADLCVKYGYKKCITKNKNLWWMSVPSIDGVYKELFKGERKKVVTASTEDSNSRCPEMNLMGRGGLWQAGLRCPAWWRWA